MDISLLQAAHGRRNISRFWPRWVDHLLWRSCRSLTMTFPLSRFNTQLRGWLNCWKRGLLMFVVNPWPMILKPFCMHFVSFPKTLKYFFSMALGDIGIGPYLQRTFKGPVLGEVLVSHGYVYDLCSIYSPPWEQGYTEEISGSFRFLGSSFSESLKKGWSIFLVAGFHFHANSCARMRFLQVSPCIPLQYLFSILSPHGVVTTCHENVWSFKS